MKIRLFAKNKRIADEVKRFNVMLNPDGLLKVIDSFVANGWKEKPIYNYISIVKEKDNTFFLKLETRKKSNITRRNILTIPSDITEAIFDVYGRQEYSIKTFQKTKEGKIKRQFSIKGIEESSETRIASLAFNASNIYKNENEALYKLNFTFYIPKICRELTLQMKIYPK